MLGEARQRIGALAVLLFAPLVLALAAVSVFLLGHSYLASPGAFNSDDLLCSAVCDDLLHGRELTGWHLPGAPYVFPDMLLLAPVHLLAPNIVAEFLAYCFAVHLGLLAVLTWLGRLTGLGWRPALTAAAGGALLLAALHLGKQPTARAIYLVHPGSHTGAILIGLFLLALTIRSLRYGPSWAGAITFLLAGGLGIFSDKLLLPQFLAPLALALVVLAARRIIPIRRAGGQLVLLGASLVLALGVQIVFRRLGFHLLEVETPLIRLRLPDLFLLLRRLYQGIAHEYLLCLLIPLHLLAALLCASRVRHNACDAGVDRGAVMLAALTVILSPLCAIGTLFVLSMAHHPAIDRYTLSCCFLPCLLLPLLLGWLPGRAARAGRLLVQLGVVLLAVQRVAVLLPDVERRTFEPPYPPLARALDRLARQRGPLYGLGGFWLARSTNWFTREHVVINPLSPTGEPFFHASNSARYLSDDGAELRIPDYQCLLLRAGDSFGPSPAVLTLHFGPPAEKIAVGGDEIWLYDSLRSPPFDRFLRSRLAGRLEARRPSTGPIEPACLARPKAGMTPADNPGNVALEAGQSLEVRFGRPVSGRLLDVGAYFDNRFDLDFYRGAERLGRLAVPAVSWAAAGYGLPGIQSRLLSLPAGLRGRTWDRITVRPRPGSAKIRLGHLLVFAEDVPGLDQERPAACPRRLRLEGETLLPINPGTPFTDDADPSASGGRARRAAVDFACSFARTPPLFLPPGRYRLECALKVGDDSIPDEVARLQACCVLPPAILGERPLRGRDFPSTCGYTRHALTFEVAEGMESIRFGVAASGKTPVTLDYIDVIAGPEDARSDPGFSADGDGFSAGSDQCLPRGHR